MLAIERGTTLPGGQNRTPGAPHQGAGRQLAQLREAGARGESARRLERSGTDRSEAVSTAVARPQNRGAHPTHNRPPGCAGRLKPVAAGVHAYQQKCIACDGRNGWRNFHDHYAARQCIVAVAVKTIAHDLTRAGIVDVLGATGDINVQGEMTQKLDRISNDAFLEAFEYGQLVSELV